MNDDKLDDLRKRWLAWHQNVPDDELMDDMWRAVQEQAAEAKAWKHANAFEPLTREQLVAALSSINPGMTWAAEAILEHIGTLYRQRRP
jgi:predicted NACHT family NTPase